MYEFEKVKGSVKPKEIDTESSQYYTYIRKNIKEVHEEDPTFDGWEYEECKVYVIYMKCKCKRGLIWFKFTLI